MDEETRLGLIAGSILDGTPVDWPVEESTSGPEDIVVVQQLRVLAEIAALHRGQSADSRGAVPTAVDQTQASARWGHLRLMEQVGKGSFGEVYRAWDTHLDREVALKILRADPATSIHSALSTDSSRVVHEGRLLARVRHPHVITVYGAEPRDGTVGIWMEFIRGTTLHQLVERQGRMSAREAVTVGTDLCRALAAVHGAGLLHRDITARNVMREEGGRVVLMDFGAGHDVVPDATGPDITGTPLYMAPELFTGRPADQRTDIYALGTLIFYLVTARFPVGGRSLAEIRDAHARGERTRLRDLRPDVSSSFVRALEKAIHPNPDERFQTAGEMEAALDAVEPTAKQPPATIRQRRWTAAALAAAALGIASVAVLLVRSGRQADDRQAPAAAALHALTTRKMTIPEGVWPFSNPSDNGQFMAGMETATGDAAIIDLATQSYRPLHVGHGDWSDGYASLGSLSPDGTAVAMDWHDDRGGSLRLARTDGSRPRVLIDTPGDVWVHQWSRDGSLILTLISKPDRPNAIALVAASDGAVRELRRIGSVVPQQMSLSPDGRYIAYDAPASGAAEHDIQILDALTGNQWELGPSPSDDTAPFWSPDGHSLVFLSDRNRNPSLWMVPIENGHPQAPPRLLKDDVGRVWLHGFTASGALHYQLYAGFAEIYLASLDGIAPVRPQPLSPRRAVSNFYPMWSTDGRFVAYGSERGAVSRGRELWVYDTATDTEQQVPVFDPIGRPYAWSSDSREILVDSPDNRDLFVVDRTTGRHRLITKENESRAAWGPAGVIFQRQGQIVAADPINRRVTRTFGTAEQISPSSDGRSAISRKQNGRMVLLNLASGATSEWQDSGIESLGNHFVAPHTSAVAYVATRKSVNSDVKTLMLWGGAGAPRELLRTSVPEQFTLAGWTADGLGLVIVRWSRRPNAPVSEPRNETLWRVPITGGAPVSTGLMMEYLRDISIDPDGRRMAFNAGMKRVEHWAMENLSLK